MDYVGRTPLKSLAKHVFYGLKVTSSVIAEDYPLIAI